MSDLAGCTNFSNEVLIQLLENDNGHLSTLDLSGCAQLELGIIGLRRSGSPTKCKMLLLKKIPNMCDSMMGWIAEGCRNLQYIDLSDSNLSDSCLDYLSAGCKTIRTFILNGCRNITDEGIQRFVTAAGQYINDIQLQRCNLISDRSIQVISEQCKRLQSLNIKGVPNVTNRGIFLISKSCRQLHFLDISIDIGTVNSSSRSHVPHISGNGLGPLGKYSSSLKTLKCGGVTGIEKFSKVVSGCPNLIQLSLRYCYKITDSDVQAIADNCKGLKSVDLGFCKELSDVSIVKLGTQCRLIECIILRGCYKLTDVSIIKLTRFCPNMNSLDLNSVENITDAALMEVIRNLKYLHFADFTLTQVSQTGVSLLEKSLEYSQKLSRKLVFQSHHNSIEGYKAQRKVSRV